MSPALSLVVRRSAPAAVAVPRRYTAWQRFVHGAALLLAAVAFGLLILFLGPPWMRSLFGAVSFGAPGIVSALFLATVFSLVLHELGHLLAAVSLDFEVLGISLGPVRLLWLHGKYAVRFSAKRLFLGSVSVAPNGMRNWRSRAMWVAAAGPLATLFAALGACGIAVLGHSAGMQHTFWCALAQINLFIFALGLMPNSPFAAMRNDAALLRMLFLNGPEAREWELVHLIGQLRLHAVRPSDYPGPLMDRLLTHSAIRPATRVLVARTLSDWALDSGDIRTADSWDREAAVQVLHCEPRLRNSTLAASACFDVVFRGDMGSARVQFAQVNLDELFPPCFAHRARAARLLAMDLPRLAPAEIIRAQYALPRGLDYYDFERTLLEKLHLQALSSVCKTQNSRYNSIEGRAVVTCQPPRSDLQVDFNL
jgi:hypothetical protein